MSGRKHFVSIAAALNAARARCEPNAQAGVDAAAICIAESFDAESRAFDKELFLYNAGVVREHGWRGARVPGAEEKLRDAERLLSDISWERDITKWGG